MNGKPWQCKIGESNIYYLCNSYIDLILDKGVRCIQVNELVHKSNRCSAASD